MYLKCLFYIGTEAQNDEMVALEFNLKAEVDDLQKRGDPVKDLGLQVDANGIIID